MGKSFPGDPLWRLIAWTNGYTSIEGRNGRDDLLPRVNNCEPRGSGAERFSGKGMILVG